MSRPGEVIRMGLRRRISGLEAIGWRQVMLDSVSLSDLDLQRADGLGRVVLTGSEHGTRVVDLFQRSPIRIMFPGIRGNSVEEVVVVNTAGGIAGGDRL